MNIARALCLTGLLLTGGCASKLQVAEISPTAAGGPIAGIPFRVPQRYELIVYEKTGTGFRQVHTQTVTLADPRRLFVLGFESQAFNNSTADFQINEDNTLKQVGLKSESKGAGFLTETGAQISAIATAKKQAQDAKDAREAAAKAGLLADAAETTQAVGLDIAADKAWQAAQLADLQALNLRKDPSATSEALLKADNLARTAKLDANESARRAGKQPYYPEVLP